MDGNGSAGFSSNRILNMLSNEDFASIGWSLEEVEMPQGFVMARAEALIDYVYFPSSGFGSVMVVGENGKRAEAGMFGREGFTPLAAAVGDDRSIYEIVMQAHGGGHRVPIESFSKAVNARPMIAAVLAKFTHVFAAQVAYTALSNATDHVDRRLARWILMSHDRIDGDVIRITHDYIAVMLGVRRPGVTTSLHVLEGLLLIRSERGAITIRDRLGLEAYAGKSYGRPEQEYERVLGASAPELCLATG
ncbi:Crp/Fnr family transcriptional regulator [Rhizobium sp. Rhizsp82]|uniref:Crp/Fnr family transcriptional regulator n=1 Tax=Rhizobium sp. Rhizsp82 TaxID=3243057 RepID=UPI0039B3F85C